MYSRWNTRLKKVTWGYRDRFEQSLKCLYESGQLVLDRENPAFKAFDDTFMELVGKDYCRDHAGSYFLQVLEKKLSWIISIPELMENWGRYGLELLDEKLCYGIRYFELWDKKVNVTDPSELSKIMSLIRLIDDRIDSQAALAFLEGYPIVIQELPLDKVHDFVLEGISMFHSNPSIACKFFLLELSSARKLIEVISKRCCLKDIKQRMERLFVSICNAEFAIGDISKLDTDELIDKGSKVVCFSNSIYLPSRVTMYDNIKDNKDWYLSAAYSNACSYVFKGFTTVHALPGFESCQSFLAGANIESDSLSQKLFCTCDQCRVLLLAFKRYKGLKCIILNAIKKEIKTKIQADTFGLFDAILCRLVTDDISFSTDISLNKRINDFSNYAKTVIMECASFYELINALPDIKKCFKAIFRFDNNDFYGIYDGQLSFYSDYNYQTDLSDMPRDENRFKLDSDNEQDELQSDSDKDKDNQITRRAYADSNNEKEQEDQSEEKSAGYYYNEWNNDTQDYLPQWCFLREVTQFYISQSTDINEIVDREQIKRIKRVFEKFKPELMEKQKYLTDGDETQLEPMIDFIVQKKAKMCPEDRIYCKQYKEKRDIAAALLIDISGSTSETISQGEKVIEVEKRAAFLLAEGLCELGDTFGIFGFSGSGRENCSYYIFKDFEEDWNNEQQQRLVSCRPNGSTRIGVAIRHTVEKLNMVESNDKLIIVATDGKPQDSDGYTSEGLYAQYDVRKAVLEAKQQGIAVFCISTENNRLDELELMFPVKRYVIVDDISNLPQSLIKAYTKMTL